MLIFFVLIHLFYFWGIEGLTQTGASSSAGTAVGAEVSDAATAVDLLCAVQAEVPPPPQATFCKKKNARCGPRCRPAEIFRAAPLRRARTAGRAGFLTADRRSEALLRRIIDRRRQICLSTSCLDDNISLCFAGCRVLASRGRTKGARWLRDRAAQM